MPDLVFDAATTLSIGQRDHQEDAVALDFPSGASFGFGVISDGMGGHAAGDVASKIVVTEVFSELKLRAGDVAALETDLNAILRAAVFGANECIRYHSDTYPGTRGMGATLVAPIFVKNRLYWVSVGDSPLFLFRNGILTRLNEDHSMVPQIDYLVRTGLMDAQTGLNHPDRHCLTSVLAGAPIPLLDCQSDPVVLRPGDIVLAASDGLLFLEDARIAAHLRWGEHHSSADICARILADIESLDDPDQDNVSLCIVKVGPPDAADVQPQAPLAAASGDIPQPRRLRRKSVTVMASISRARAAAGARANTDSSPF